MSRRQSIACTSARSPSEQATNVIELTIRQWTQTLSSRIRALLLKFAQRLSSTILMLNSLKCSSVWFITL